MLPNFVKIICIKSCKEYNKIIFSGLAKRVGARVLIASTSEVYGDPEVHPQPETYWGHVNPIGKQ